MKNREQARSYKALAASTAIPAARTDMIGISAQSIRKHHEERLQMETIERKLEELNCGDYRNHL
jgi:hypothetical protein